METVKKYMTGIKVKDGGMKGLEVSYNHQEEKNGKTWNIEDWQDRKIPIGEKLDEVIKAFRYYLLDVFGYNMDDVNVSDVKIKELKFDGEIMISGELRVLNGDRTVNLKTCKIDDSCEYEKMSELQGLVRQLKDELALYMDGKSIMSEKQLVMEFYKGKKGFNEEEFAGLSEEELKVKYTKALEEMGSIVIHQDDMAVGDVKVDTVSMGAPVVEKKESVVEAVVVSPNFDVAPAIVPVDSKVVDIVVGEGEDEVFMVTPVAVNG